MRLEDLAGVLILIEDVAAEGLWIRTEPGFDRQRYLEYWREQVRDPSAVVIVAVEEHRVLGFADLYAHATLGPLLGMFVALPYRERGIGRALLMSVLDAARERGLKSIGLHVFPHNERAIGLYRSVGFVESARVDQAVPRSSGEVWDTIRMTLTL